MRDRRFAKRIQRQGVIVVGLAGVGRRLERLSEIILGIGKLCALVCLSALGRQRDSLSGRSHTELQRYEWFRLRFRAGLRRRCSQGAGKGPGQSSTSSCRRA